MTAVTDRLFVVLALVSVGSVLARPRPQALRADTELPDATLDTRWDTDSEDALIEDIGASFRNNEGMQRAVVDVLRGLNEAELRLLERLLVPRPEDRPQSDMPLEELVDDGPQELDAPDEFQEDLVVVDPVASTTATPPSNSTGDTLFPQLHKISREKLKEMRLETIKNQIMTILWPSGVPPTTGANLSTLGAARSVPIQRDLLRAIADKMNAHKTSFPPVPTDLYTEKIQSFYPSCEIPRNTDEELWSSGDAMNLLFDLTQPAGKKGTQISLVAAKLRLYKISQSNESSSAESCPQGETQGTYIEEKMVRVSIYWYTRSLKKHRVKRKLLDSQMLSIHGDLWTEWNIRGAVKAWRDNGRNFGLAVEVEDEDGSVLQTNKFFAPMNCSQEAATSRPIPGFLVARAFDGENTTNLTNGEALHFDTFLYPMVDLCTVEFPESERPDTVFYQRISVQSGSKIKKTASTTGLRDIPASYLSHHTPSNGTEHRIRHNNHRVTNETNIAPHRHMETLRRDDGDSIEEITWTDDLDGHQLRKQIIVQKSINKPHNSQEDRDR